MNFFLKDKIGVLGLSKSGISSVKFLKNKGFQVLGWDDNKQILKKIKQKKIKYFIIDLTKNNNFKKDKNCYFINIGKFGKILNLIKKKKCNKVLFAGLIKKPKISSLKLDLKGIYYLPRIIRASKLGDAAILKELIQILSENKIKVIKLNSFNPELTLIKGNYTKLSPNKFELSRASPSLELDSNSSFNSN